MALKDWKKININYYFKTGDYGRTALRIYHHKRGVALTPYQVGIMRKGIFIQELKYFKTKSKALAYAKKYMRSH